MQHHTNTQPSVPVPTAGGPMMSTSADINRWRAFALLAVAFFMTVIDLTIVNGSLPRSVAICTSAPPACSGS